MFALRHLQGELYIMAKNPLQRFTEAQTNSFDQALAEIKNGRKRGHWIWYIFPQIAGLGFSETSHYYAITDLEEATEYLAHPVLGERLIRITKTLLDLNSTNALQIFGTPDNLKLKSSMTLFFSVKNSDGIFNEVLDKFFNGEKDEKTLQILRNQQEKH